MRQLFNVLGGLARWQPSRGAEAGGQGGPPDRVRQDGQEGGHEADQDSHLGHTHPGQ